MEKTTTFEYMARRDTFFSMRLCKRGERFQFDTALVGIPPHHFRPIGKGQDRGPVGKAPAVGPRSAHAAREAASQRADP